MQPENKNTEYKREYTDEIKKTVIAFANTTGGIIKIGVNDDLSINGIIDIDDTILKCTNMIRDTIKPDITMFVDYQVMKIGKKSILSIEIQSGTMRPYYIASKGIRPEGVFVRQGASSVPASESLILKMIKETSGDDYETLRSINQNLTFNYCKEEFEQANLKFQKEQMISLKILGIDGLYSNLALLLSDQCTLTTKVAVFEGTSKEFFKDRDEFTGSLFKQLYLTFDFIERYNRNRSEIHGLKRVDNFDYPQIAIREALLNALVHRDYSFSSSTLISIFSNRIEIVTVGGLLRGITKSDMLLGVSILRNKNLANIFYRLKLIEAYGTGVLKILESYEKYPTLEPLIEISDNAFKITLFNTNEYTNNNFIDSNTYHTTHDEQKIINYIQEHQNVIRKEIEETFNISKTMAARHLKSLINKNIITKNGSGKNISYCLNKR